MRMAVWDDVRLRDLMSDDTTMVAHCMRAYFEHGCVDLLRDVVSNAQQLAKGCRQQKWRNRMHMSVSPSPRVCHPNRAQAPPAQRKCTWENKTIELEACM
jgi:hypothetical protein